MYVTPEDLLYLKNSPSLGKIFYFNYFTEVLVLNYKHICRQYAYFYNQFYCNKKFRHLFNNRFCFKDYWYVFKILFIYLFLIIE